jgi:hypothetical protein
MKIPIVNLNYRIRVGDEWRTTFQGDAYDIQDEGAKILIVDVATGKWARIPWSAVLWATGGAEDLRRPSEPSKLAKGHPGKAGLPFPPPLERA